MLYNDKDYFNFRSKFILLMVCFCSKYIGWAREDGGQAGVRIHGQDLSSMPTAIPPY
ncbi:hypothetical protein BGS_1216 [Beggiatoa sp. SS]|nr:hypothetical protein BGS_1216 [Beggiatoa sp. SS]